MYLKAVIKDERLTEHQLIGKLRHNDENLVQHGVVRPLVREHVLLTALVNVHRR